MSIERCRSSFDQCLGERAGAQLEAHLAKFLSLPVVASLLSKVSEPVRAHLTCVGAFSNTTFATGHTPADLQEFLSDDTYTKFDAALQELRKHAQALDCQQSICQITVTASLCTLLRSVAVLDALLARPGIAVADAEVNVPTAVEKGVDDVRRAMVPSCGRLLPEPRVRVSGRSQKGGST